MIRLKFTGDTPKIFSWTNSLGGKYSYSVKSEDIIEIDDNQLTYLLSFGNFFEVITVVPPGTDPIDQTNDGVVLTSNELNANKLIVGDGGTNIEPTNYSPSDFSLAGHTHAGGVTPWDRVLNAVYLNRSSISGPPGTYIVQVTVPIAPLTGKDYIIEVMYDVQNSSDPANKFATGLVLFKVYDNGMGSFYTMGDFARSFRFYNGVSISDFNISQGPSTATFSFFVSADSTYDVRIVARIVDLDR